MSGHRRWFVLLLGWLFFLSLLGQIQDLYRLDPAVLGLFYLVAVLPLCRIGFSRLSHLGYTAVGLGVLWAAKFAWLGAFSGFELAMTVVESSFLAVTSFLALRYAQTLCEAEGLLSELTRLSLPHPYPNATAAGPEMEKELRRARRYRRPLSMVTIETPDVLDLEDPELKQSVREHLTRQYAVSCIADILQNETKTTDIVSYADGRFILMLPETHREEAARLVDRLKRRVQGHLAADLKAGMSSFPSEELTIFGLMERSAPAPAPAVPIQTHDRFEFVEETPAERAMAEAV